MAQPVREIIINRVKSEEMHKIKVTVESGYFFVHQYTQYID